MKNAAGENAKKWQRSFYRWIKSFLDLQYDYALRFKPQIVSLILNGLSLLCNAALILQCTSAYAEYNPYNR